MSIGQGQRSHPLYLRYIQPGGSIHCGEVSEANLAPVRSSPFAIVRNGSENELTILLRGGFEIMAGLELHPEPGAKVAMARAATPQSHRLCASHSSSISSLVVAGRSGQADITR